MSWLVTTKNPNRKSVACKFCLKDARKREQSLKNKERGLAKKYFSLIFKKPKVFKDGTPFAQLKQDLNKRKETLLSSPFSVKNNVKYTQHKHSKEKKMNLKTSIIASVAIAVLLAAGLSVWAHSSSASQAAYREAAIQRDLVWEGYVEATQNAEDAAIVRNLSLDVRKCRPDHEISDNVKETIKVIAAAEMKCLDRMKDTALQNADSRTPVLIDWVKKTS